VPIDSLRLLDGNPRRGDVDAVARSLARFGQRKPVVANRDGTVLAGNHTLLAAQSLGWESLAVLYVDDDAATAKAFALADNRTAALGSFDDEQLAVMLAEVQAADPELLAAASFGDDDLAALLGHEDGGAPGPVPGLVYPDEHVVDAALAHYRTAGFPYPPMPTHAAMQEINALAALDTDRLAGSDVGYHVADPYQPHRFETPVAGACTPMRQFHRDERLRYALELSLQNGKITDSSLLGTLAWVRNAQCAAQFRPGFALLMFRRFAPAGGTVLDTSTGFGGRLVGFFASDCGTYIGIDPNTATVAGNEAMTAELCPAGKRVELLALPAEDVPAAQLAGRADFAFTSPPYFAKELYSDEPTQSCVRYANGEAWRVGFLLPLLALQYAALVPGAYACLNVADVTVRGERYPLTEWTVNAGRTAGFAYERTERYPLSRVPGRGEHSPSYEQLVVLRRPLS
jgi:hypothetical protein